MPEVADTCIEIALPFLKDENILEPAGGTGEFIDGLIRAGVYEERLYSFDIEPRHGYVEKGDFLLQKLTQDFFVISNPPFGRANSLSIKFFNHAAPFATYICFLIPKAWRKWSVVNKLNKKFHLVEDVEMPPVAFYNEAGPIKGGNLKTLFQVWERREEERNTIVITDRGYLKKSTPEEADVAITLFGYSSGKVETEFKRESNTTKKFFTVADSSVIEGLNSVDFSRFNRNVSYTYSLSLQEINYLLNEWYDK